MFGLPSNVAAIASRIGCDVGRNVAVPASTDAVDEKARFEAALEPAVTQADYVVVDTPGSDTHLSRLAHTWADTLLTPLNDSFIDLDVLVKLDPVTLAMTGLSHYGEMVRETRRHRRSVDGRLNDWLVVRVARFTPPAPAVCRVLV